MVGSKAGSRMPFIQVREVKAKTKEKASPVAEAAGAKAKEETAVNRPSIVLDADQKDEDVGVKVKAKVKVKDEAGDEVDIGGAPGTGVPVGGPATVGGRTTRIESTETKLSSVITSVMDWSARGGRTASTLTMFRSSISMAASSLKEVAKAARAAARRKEMIGILHQLESGQGSRAPSGAEAWPVRILSTIRSRRPLSLQGVSVRIVSFSLRVF